MTVPGRNHRTVGTALVEMLEHLGTEVVFGIPGVHTIEMYRGLADARLRHVTPRHEQGAGFMADGYARASGRPGVCFLITGPGLTNALTAMAQALQDSVPMLVITGVNPDPGPTDSRGRLHELPDQQGLVRALTPHSYRLRHAQDLPGLLARAYEIFAAERPGPVHLEIPIDLFGAPMPDYALPEPRPRAPHPDAGALDRGADRLAQAKSPLVLAGGGCRGAEADVLDLAACLGAPVVSTVNARAGLGGADLHVPASPSLPQIRAAMAQADLVLALGTELGPTDYDIYVDGGFPDLADLIRVDIDARQLGQGPRPTQALCGRVGPVAQALAQRLRAAGHRPAPAAVDRARTLRDVVQPRPGSALCADLEVLATLARVLPGCVIVGNSTQVVYSGNMLLPDPMPGGWFNAATGFGTLGYAPGAAIGAALARPDAPVVCLVGDGGLQFTLSELGAAKDAGVGVIFLVWNNHGYKEIARYMVDAGVTPVGVTPSPPDLRLVAEAYGLPSWQVSDLAGLEQALTQVQALTQTGPVLVEWRDDA